MGTLPTVLLVVVTGVLGAWLARREGFGILARIRKDLQDGRVPGPAIVDGVIVLIAGMVLITPGLLTDIVGFLCLIPSTRRFVRAQAWRMLMRAVERGGRGDIRVTYDATPFRAPDVIDHDPDR